METTTKTSTRTAWQLEPRGLWLRDTDSRCRVVGDVCVFVSRILVLAVLAVVTLFFPHAALLKEKLWEKVTIVAASAARSKANTLHSYQLYS